MENAAGFNSEQHQKFSLQLDRLTRKAGRFVWYRLAVFVSLFFPVSIWGLTWGAGAATFLLLVFFFYLLKVHLILGKERKRAAVLKQITHDELLALKHRFLHFPDGKKFLNADHFFSYDLDLFGKGSLFQFLNRTTTLGGSRNLAGWLMAPFCEKSEIEKRQEAIRELASNPEWRLQFQAEGKLFEETESLENEIRAWSGKEFRLLNPRAIKWLLRIVPAVSLFALLAAVAGWANTPLVLLVLFQWVMMIFFWKRINEYFEFFGRKSELLKKYMQLLELIEGSDFTSQHLADLRRKVSEPPASKSFARLKKLVGQFEYRQNLVVGMAFNSLLLWDIRCVYFLWLWQRHHQAELEVWLDIIAEMDALVSLGNYANNHPGFTFPAVAEGGFQLSATEFGHPLLKAEKRVCNNVEINGWSKAMIVTGANMAGKSTFLRTVGVNLLLAGIGAPVCARNMIFTPVELYTNMRTTDSLLNDESYFFAELKRIKTVLDRLQRGERIFVILDEMLKGTNSIDKLNGSKELVRKLVEFKAVSLIATHDLKLSEMENELPGRVFNRCFEIRIENDELVFDYKLSDGVTKTMNATFLMKKMGII